MAGNGSIVTLDLPKPVAAGQLVTVSIDEVTNAFAAPTTSLTLWTSSDPVPVRLPFTLTTPGSISGASAKLPSTAAGATSVDYEIRFRTGVHGALAPGDGPLQGGVGSAPTEAVTLLAPPGTVFPNCFGFEQGCWPTYVIDGQPAVGNLARDGAMVTLAVPKAVGAGQPLDISIDEVTNASATGPTSLAAWTSSDPVVVRIPLSLTAPRAVLAPSLSMSTTSAGASGVDYQVAFTTGPAVLWRRPLVSSKGVSARARPRPSTWEAPPGTKFAECLSGCPDYPSYLVDGADAGASFSAGGRVLSLALPKPIAPSTRVVLSIGEVSNSVTAGPKKLLVWTSDDPRPAVLAYSLAPPAAVVVTCPADWTGCQEPRPPTRSLGEVAPGVH